MPKYFETEVPVSVITDAGEFRFYREAQRLQMSRPKWKNLNDEVLHGKSVTLDIAKFQGNAELKALLEMVLADIG